MNTIHRTTVDRGSGKSRHVYEMASVVKECKLKNSWIILIIFLIFLLLKKCYKKWSGFCVCVDPFSNVPLFYQWPVCVWLTHNKITKYLKRHDKHVWWTKLHASQSYFGENKLYWLPTGVGLIYQLTTHCVVHWNAFNDFWYILIVSKMYQKTTTFVLLTIIYELFKIIWKEKCNWNPCVRQVHLAIVSSNKNGIWSKLFTLSASSKKSSH